MTQIVQLSGKYACQACGNLVAPDAKSCGTCKQQLEGIKVIELQKLQQEQKRPYKSRMEILHDKLRNNEQLVMEDFVSPYKLKDLKKGDKIKILM